MPSNGLPTVRLVGVGAALPEPCLSNEDLSQIVETSDEWIWPRTGIRQRRILPPHLSLVDLAAQAARAALDQAGIPPRELDLILLATSTAVDRFGSAPQVQAALGATGAVAFDLTAACTGFVFAVATAAQFLQTGLYRRALVVAADVLSRTVDWADRTTCVLFGDGAGAVVLEAGEAGAGGILGIELRSDGSGSELLSLSMATEARPLVGSLQVGQYRCCPIAMNGREVYKFAVQVVPEIIEKVLFRTGIPAEAVQGYFIHQANQRILDAVAKRLQLDPQRVASVLEQYGNTSGASVPIALATWIAQGRFGAGDLGVMAGFGAGLTWGAIVFRWGK
ncbi:beta-ketoacyl-ACP synthase III [Synechococcus sp. H55.10]|uniref:beta-ketoacyl-ACP synthase III n=1 Tax=Synechococcus sp. H55.10 TaxID=2964503 RepID=UPI0039C6A8E7